MEHREEYYWIKTKRYGWEIAVMVRDGENIHFNVMNDGGTEEPKNVIQAIRIPYPDENDTPISWMEDKSVIK